MSSLVALFGPKQGLRIPLVGRIDLGRGPEADIQLVDGKVSREHCRIDADGARPLIEDRGSQNGTFVNGNPIRQPTPLHHGDEIVVGDTLLLVADDNVEVANAVSVSDRERHLENTEHCRRGCSTILRGPIMVSISPSRNYEG